MQFGCKWRKWILGSLSSGRALVLVNGSPTKEFFFISRGVIQGDILSFPLHSFHGGTSCFLEIPILSHHMYADDVIFIGELSSINIINFNMLLRMFLYWFQYQS